MAIEDEFKNFVVKKTTVEPKNIIKENLDSIKRFVASKSEISDLGIVSLVVLHETKSLDEDYKNELTTFGYIDENCNITDAGKSFIESKETIEKIKKIIEA